MDITTFDLLNFRKANPVGILAGSELQNGFGVFGGTTTSSSSSTKNKNVELNGYNCERKFTTPFLLLIYEPLSIPKESTF